MTAEKIHKRTFNIMKKYACRKKSGLLIKAAYDCFEMLVLFQPITARRFPMNSRSFSYTLHSDDSS